MFKVLRFLVVSHLRGGKLIREKMCTNFYVIAQEYCKMIREIYSLNAKKLFKVTLCPVWRYMRQWWGCRERVPTT